MEYLAGVMTHMREMQARRTKDEGGSLDAPIAAAESAGMGGADDAALLADLMDCGHTHTVASSLRPKG